MEVGTNLQVVDGAVVHYVGVSILVDSGR
jgi:hypothetical protein